jgi:mannose-6-phosphate isomerase-like protein (cupin superfamily)
MKINNLKDMIRGWFIGNFEPSLWKTHDFEIAIQSYKKGDTETPHIHRIATEINVVISGEVEMNNRKFIKDDIIINEPGERVEFKSLQDSTLVVVKIPCVKGDKYLG